tara:strand:- start:1098 stop:1721 length:624 start_codon:yes stop_codon:yes gene_type:complete
LSFWQLDRGNIKSEQHKNFLSLSKKQPIKIRNLDINLENYTNIEIVGDFIKKPQFLLDNIVINRKPGYEIITPLRFKNKIILVNRGWIDNNYRQIVPDINIIDQHSPITGYIYYYKKTFTLNEDVYTKKDSLIIQNIDIKSIEKILNQPVMPYILIMHENQTNSYIRKKIYKKNPEYKHYMYAGQWLLFAIIALIFSFKLLKRKENE